MTVSLPERCLVSVTDKQGLKELLEGLLKLNPKMEIIASGGTGKYLAENSINYTPLESYTGFSECFGGRVKTLHPKVAGGILFHRDRDAHEAASHCIPPIDLVICNLYDFGKAAAKHADGVDEVIEEMDIGGPTLIRAAIKNHKFVTILSDPQDYHQLLEAKGSTEALRMLLASRAINRCADYEALLAVELTRRLTGEFSHRPKLQQGKRLRYGENPNQDAWVYRLEGENGIAYAKQLSGKPPSYNNYEDATAAYRAAQELSSLGVGPGVAIIKHGSLCAYATGETAKQAFLKAWAGDAKSAFGSVIAFTHPVDIDIKEAFSQKFVEVLIAPHFTPEVVQWMHEHKPNVRLFELPLDAKPNLLYKTISGGILVQTPHVEAQVSAKWWNDGVVTQKRPDTAREGLYKFSVAAVKFAKSNAIVITREPTPGFYQVVGVGAGQPNRVDSLQRLAIPKAIENLKEFNREVEGYEPSEDLAKCLLASDGFFPFPDSIEYAAEQGLQECVQPGGSVRDGEVIQAADEKGMSMVLTGERYFYH